MAAVRELVGADRSLLVVHRGDESPTSYGRGFAQMARSAGLSATECVVAANTDAWARFVMRCIEETSPDYVVGAGGGRVIDVAKVAASETGRDFISVPTQAASDGICSPVAVMVDESGSPRSVGARIPAAIVVDMQVLGQAPETTWLSGLGDLISNLSAVRDWRFAHELYGEPLDDFACLTAEAAALSVYTEAARISDPEYQERLIRGLILSGIAMEMAGSSRPASGPEHLVSHALDRLLSEPRQHGLQVALATVTMHLLRGSEVARLIRFYRAVGLPVHPRDLEIEVPLYMEAIRRGPEQRPGRRTILDRLDDRDFGRLARIYDRGDL